MSNKLCKIKRRNNPLTYSLRYWKCTDCGFELKDISIQHPIVCQCGRVEKRDGTVTYIRKLNSSGEFATVPANATTLHPTQAMSKEEALATYKALKANKGRRSWKVLHQKQSGTPEELRTFYNLWKTTIPRDCACQREYSLLESTNPPDFSSPENFWLWGHDTHNLVNKRLSEEGSHHQQISLETATRQWKTKYALWQPMDYGGLEHWSLALNKYLPSFGIIRKIPGAKSIDPILEQRASSELVDVTFEDVLYHEKPLITSIIYDINTHLPLDIICVGHGNCVYTEKWVRNTKDVATSFVGVSKNVSRLIEKCTGKPCVTIENGIDTTRLIPSLSREELRTQYGIPTNAYVIGYTGRSSEEKRLNDLIEAVSKVPDAYLLLVGWMNVLDIPIMAKLVGMQDRVITVPAVSNIGNALEMMDVFVSCSLSEGFGLSTMEAMMFGLPIACSNVGIVTELLEEHGDIGIQTFKPGSSPGAVASAIKRASKCQINLSKYTAEAMANRWKDYLEERENG